MLTNLDLQINANEVFESAIESNHDILSYCQSVESIMKYATTQFKPLAEKYGLFQNFQMISPALKNITVQYSNDAFKEMTAESDEAG
jgi:hypothetical protein